EDGPAADTDDVAHDLRELQVGILERLLNAQHMARDFMHELSPGAREIAELLNRRRWYKAATDQTVRQQVSDPGRVVHVALTPRYVADVHRIRQYQGDVLFEHMPDGLPIHARRLHRDVRTAVPREPLHQLEQPAGRRCHRAMGIRDLRPSRDPSAGGDAASVYVETGT